MIKAQKSGFFNEPSSRRTNGLGLQMRLYASWRHYCCCNVSVL